MATKTIGTATIQNQSADVTLVINIPVRATASIAAASTGVAIGFRALSGTAQSVSNSTLATYAGIERTVRVLIGAGSSMTAVADPVRFSTVSVGAASVLTASPNLITPDFGDFLADTGMQIRSSAMQFGTVQAGSSSDGSAFATLQRTAVADIQADSQIGVLGRDFWEVETLEKSGVWTPAQYEVMA